MGAEYFSNMSNKYKLRYDVKNFTKFVKEKRSTPCKMSKFTVNDRLSFVTRIRAALELAPHLY